jgi:hypothetical protein
MLRRAVKKQQKAMCVGLLNAVTKNLKGLQGEFVSFGNVSNSHKTAAW